MPGAIASRGLNWMVVSNISSGAGSVAVSARPALPNTLAPRARCLDHAVGLLQQFGRLPADSPGSAVGMYSRSPSSSGGMNSPPRRLSGQTA
jgi:hypothetical protein